MLHRTRRGLAAIFFLISSRGTAQVPRFDVATVRMNRNGRAGSLVRTPGGLTATNAEFSRLIELAFRTRSVDLSGVPAALRGARFDIAARAAGRITGDQHWDMLRLLLEERFRLKHHTERRSADVYTLTLLRPGGQLGPKIMLSADPDCPVNPTGASFCGVTAQPGQMVGERVTMSRIARELSAFTDRPVQDRSEVPGRFDFQLRWTPDENRPTDGKVKLLNGDPLDDSGPSLYSAVREQLGLKLQPARGTIDVLVIDHAEPPDGN